MKSDKKAVLKFTFWENGTYWDKEILTDMLPDDNGQPEPDSLLIQEYVLSEVQDFGCFNGDRITMSIKWEE
jgi:hypothetical protein